MDKMICTVQIQIFQVQKLSFLIQASSLCSCLQHAPRKVDRTIPRNCDIDTCLQCHSLSKFDIMELAVKHHCRVQLQSCQLQKSCSLLQPGSLCPCWQHACSTVSLSASLRQGTDTMILLCDGCIVYPEHYLHTALSLLRNTGAVTSQ